jgi:hypothetical protein
MLLISMSLRKGVSLALSVDFVRVVRGLTELWAPTTGDVDFGVAAVIDVELLSLLLDPNLRGPAEVETETCGNVEVRFGMLDRERLASLFEELELRRYDSCSCPVSFLVNGDEGAEKVDFVVRKEGRLDCGISVLRFTGLSSTFAIYLSATFEGPVKESRDISTELRLLVSILLDAFTAGGEGNLGFAMREGR